MVFMVQITFGQNNNTCTASILRRTVSLEIPKQHTDPQIDLQLANKKLKTDNRLIISGSVLTACGGALMLAGGVYALVPPKPETSSSGHLGHRINYTAPMIWIMSTPFFGAGIPLLAVGLVERKKWRGVKKELTVQAGIMSNGGLGVAMGF